MKSLASGFVSISGLFIGILIFVLASLEFDMESYYRLTDATIGYYTFLKSISLSFFIVLTSYILSKSIDK